MPDNIIVENCSPTLAGIKTGNIFTVDRNLISDINEDTRKGVKCVGYWKVYGDKEKAEKTFSSYKKCTEVYKKCLSGGRHLSQMIVNTTRNRCAAS